MIHTLLSEDTICAVSTPPGVGGIAVIRVSGPEAVSIVSSVWTGRPLEDVKSHTVHVGYILDPDSGRPLDQAVATVFRAPRSFTGEDVVEISVHGSRWIQAELVRLLVRRGCRVAEPGEFTRRAFTNGRLDLAEAEAVADMIASSSRAAQSIAMSQLRGDFSRKIGELRDQLIELASLLELELDFTEEDVEFASRSALLELAEHVRTVVRGLADSFESGAAIRDGVPVAIVGATNAGKSSLLNALLGDDRAIVSDIHGTTRDTIEDLIDIEGISFRLIDTAGLRETNDPVESLGIERSLRAARAARILIWVIDSTAPLPDIAGTMRKFGESLGDVTRLIVAVNKSDLSNSRPEAVIEATAGASAHCVISAVTGAGISGLRDTMLRVSGLSDALTGTELIVTNQRHYQALMSAGESLDRVVDGLHASLSGDFIAQDLRETIHHLSLITGAITTTDLLTTIFTRFCIGK